MTGKLMIRVFAVFCLLCSFSLVYGDVSKGDFAIGINYPGLGARYFISNKAALELKGQSADNISVGGLRGYYYFNAQDKLLPFMGLEGDYVSFQGNLSKGTGFAGEIFIGGEYFLSNKFSVQMDIGPGIASLTCAA